MSAARRKLAVATWTRPTEGLILGRLTVPAAPVEAFAAEHSVDVSDVVAAAGGRALAKAEGINGRLVFGRFVPHSRADLSLRRGAETQLIRAADRRAPADIDGDVVRIPPWIGALPTLLARPFLALVGFVTAGLGLPLFGLPAFPHGGAMLTVLDSAHLDEAWAPPPPFASPAVHVLMLPAREEAIAVDGDVVVQRRLTLCVTVDHRFLDGFEGAVLAQLLRDLLADPTRMS